MLQRERQGEDGMNFRMTLLCAVALAFGLGSAYAQPANVSPELARIIDGAKKEGKLLLRSTTSVNGASDGAKVAQEGIKKMFETFFQAYTKIVHKEFVCIVDPEHDRCDPCRLPLRRERSGRPHRRQDLATRSTV